ncbi:MAG: hypothetical protein HYV09_16300 [Deltaproteobacteria bacterium]|nr:hypothetical protein [Deltaproteobacteria bacterium]
MLLLLVGVVVIAVPVTLALTTVVRLVRALGAIDASAVGAAIASRPDLDLEKLADQLDRGAAGSIAQRIVSVATHPESGATPLQRRLALAEEVADIERRVVADVRVPRVAASLATTGGLLAAALVMREGLGITLPEGVDPVPVFHAVIEKGLTLAGVAVFGGIVCASLHQVAQRERKARLAELDALVQPLVVRLFGPDAEL